MNSKIMKFIKNPGRLFISMGNKGFFNWLDDATYLKIAYFIHFGKRLNLKNPQTFNEKLNWLKLHDRNPLYTTLVDKYAVKQWIADKIGPQYVIPTLGVWNSPEEIDFDKLPEKFVLKCTHDSGSVVICKDKHNFDRKAAIKTLNRGMKHSGYWYGREWPYKDVPRRIIAEPHLEDSQTKELRDYKFFCCDGKVDNVMVCVDRAIGDPKFYFFNKKWELLRLNKRGKEAPKDFTLQKPASMDHMFKMATDLSKGFPFVRVDLYCCNEQIYFGEMTFYPQSGFDRNLLPQTDIAWGNLIHLPNQGV